ncbi:MAG TPA: Mpo1-like protein [Steroidobacteraceae bacterium]|nr:Mpo1-like protein [Steroidobacteraceae bacterium]
MRTVQQWFDEYSESHRNPRNEVLHFLCVPPIVMTVIGFLWSIPVPSAFDAASPWLNWATIAVALGIVYYFRLSPALGVGASIGLIALLAVVRWLDTLAWPLWLTCLVVFVLAWIGQFVGHAFEGRRPSFMKDLQFLMIGPLWLLGHLYRRLGIAY